MAPLATRLPENSSNPSFVWMDFGAGVDHVSKLQYTYGSLHKPFVDFCQTHLGVNFGYGVRHSIWESAYDAT